MLITGVGALNKSSNQIINVCDGSYQLFVCGAVREKAMEFME